jgi:hypothetical protein
MKRSGEIALTRMVSLSVFGLFIGTLAATAIAPTPARADFFDDMRKTFKTDIPHFFQDDIPCAFGGKPTSGARTSCKSAESPAKPATKKPGDDAVPKEKPKEPAAPPPNSAK